MKKILSIILSFSLFLLIGCEQLTISKVSNNDDLSTLITDKEETTTIKETEKVTTMSEKKTYIGSPIGVGIWHRPNVMGDETNLDGIKKTLDIFSRCGINIVYLETIYHGMATYKSNFLPYYNGFQAHDYGEYKDYLSAFLAEAEKRNIEVHAWVEDFYIGIELGRLAESHPDWLLLDKNLNTPQKEGNGYYFLDPANKEVTDFLLNVYHELLTKYPMVKGLNLDYIRYPVSSKTDDTGYTEAAMRGFLEMVGREIKEGSTLYDTFTKAISSNYSQWTMFRASKVTNFVKSVKEMIDKEFNGVILSTAIFPNMNEAYETKKQEFSLWMKNHYIDVVTPMAYYDDTSTLSYYLKGMIDGVSDVYCYTGVSCIYHNLSNKLINEQIDACLNLSDGFVIFGSQRLLNNNNYISLLESRFKNMDYYLPHLEK